MFEPQVGIGEARGEKLLVEETPIRQLHIRQQPPIAIATPCLSVEIDRHMLSEGDSPGKRCSLLGVVHPLAFGASHLRRIDPDKPDLGGSLSQVGDVELKRIAVQDPSDEETPTVIASPIRRKGLASRRQQIGPSRGYETAVEQDNKSRPDQSESDQDGSVASAHCSSGCSPASQPGSPLFGN
jgi:hypothetical protein